MTRRAIYTTALACSIALLGAGCTFFEDDYTAEMLPFPEETDIPYGPDRGCNVETPESDQPCGGSQELDIYRSGADGPNPVAMWIHGGGFIGGDKATGVNEHLQPLLDDGWDIVAVNYRLATEDGRNRWPAALHDVKLAVRWIKANAEEQNWDPERVAAIGHSAGGNLAGMLATTANAADLEPPDLPASLAGTDSSVEAAVALNAVLDLQSYADSPLGDPVDHYLGCVEECPERVAAGSVQTHVDGESAPLMAIQGVDDQIAAPSQAELVEDAYEAAGIEDRFELIVVDDGARKFRQHEPDLKRFGGDVLDFINGEYDADSGILPA